MSAFNLEFYIIYCATHFGEKEEYDTAATLYMSTIELACWITGSLLVFLCAQLQQWWLPGEEGKTGVTKAFVVVWMVSTQAVKEMEGWKEEITVRIGRI